MIRELLILAIACGAGSLHEKPHGSAKPLAARDIVEKVDGKASKATAVR